VLLTCMQIQQIRIVCYREQYCQYCCQGDLFVEILLDKTCEDTKPNLRKTGILRSRCPDSGGKSQKTKQGQMDSIEAGRSGPGSHNPKDPLKNKLNDS